MTVSPYVTCISPLLGIIIIIRDYLRKLKAHIFWNYTQNITGGVHKYKKMYNEA